MSSAIAQNSRVNSMSGASYDPHLLDLKRIEDDRYIDYCEALASANYSCKQYQTCELKCLEGHSKCRELLEDSQSKKFTEEDQSNKVIEEGRVWVINLQFHLYAILALSRVMQNREKLTFRDCLVHKQSAYIIVLHYP